MNTMTIPTTYPTKAEARADGWVFKERTVEVLYENDNGEISLYIDVPGHPNSLHVTDADGLPHPNFDERAFRIQGHTITLTDALNKLNRRGAYTLAVRREDVEALLPKALALIEQ